MLDISYKPEKRRFGPDDIFFADGNLEFTRKDKIVDDDIDFIIDSIGAVNLGQFTCNVKGCLQKFDTPMQFNRHFDMLHRFCCQYCQRHFPSNHLLSLHLQENHDTYFEMQKEKGLSVYQCMLESCKEKFISEEARKNHLVKVHKYPANFRFSVVKRKHGKYQESKKKESLRKKTRNKTGINSTGINEEDISNAENVVMHVDSDSNIQQKIVFDEESKGKNRNINGNNEINDALMEDSNNLGRKKKYDTKKKKKNAKEGSENVPTVAMTEMETEFVDSSVGRGEVKMDVENNCQTDHKRRIPKSISFGRGVQKGFSRTRATK